MTSQEVAAIGLVERRELFIVLRQAEVELSAGLSAWLGNVTDGAERFTAQQMRAALSHVQRALQTLRTLHPHMAGALESVRTTAAQVSATHVDFQLRQFNAIFDSDVAPLGFRVAREFSRGNLLIRKHASSARRYAGEMERHIRRQLSIGMLKNESFDAMAGRLTRLGPRRLAGGALSAADGMANGLMQLPRSRAERIVRTESINSYNVFHRETIDDLADDDPDMMKRWDSTLDRRGCVLCRDLDGQVRKPNESFEIRGRVFEHPTAHPHCRCTIVPWHPEWAHDSMLSTGTEAIDAPDPRPITPRRDERAPAN